MKYMYVCCYCLRRYYPTVSFTFLFHSSAFVTRAWTPMLSNQTLTCLFAILVYPILGRTVDHVHLKHSAGYDFHNLEYFFIKKFINLLKIIWLPAPDNPKNVSIFLPKKDCSNSIFRALFARQPFAEPSLSTGEGSVLMPEWQRTEFW